MSRKVVPTFIYIGIFGCLLSFVGLYFLLSYPGLLSFDLSSFKNRPVASIYGGAKELIFGGQAIGILGSDGKTALELSGNLFYKIVTVCYIIGAGLLAISCGLFFSKRKEAFTFYMVASGLLGVAGVAFLFSGVVFNNALSPAGGDMTALPSDGLLVPGVIGLVMGLIPLIVGAFDKRLLMPQEEVYE